MTSEHPLQPIANILVDTWQGFVAVIGIAYGGVAGVRALLNTVKKAETPPVA